MKDPGSKIRDAFEQDGVVTEQDFDWLVQFLATQQDEEPNSIELLDFSVGGEGTEVSLLLLVAIGSVGRVSDVFARNFPVPFTIGILNRADPNPGHVGVSISWGQV